MECNFLFQLLTFHQLLRLNHSTESRQSRCLVRNSLVTEAAMIDYHGFFFQISLVEQRCQQTKLTKHSLSGNFVLKPHASVEDFLAKMNQNLRDPVGSDGQMHRGLRRSWSTASGNVPCKEWPGTVLALWVLRSTVQLYCK